jgi:hypothetical protein
LASDSMLHLLKTQLSACMIAKTHVSESGLTVSIQRLPGEIIPFFRTDSNTARECLKMGLEDKKSCDYLILYTLEKNNSQREVVCFLELKGVDFDHAVKQICNTYKYVDALSKRELQQDQYQRVVCSASIIMHNSAPTEAETRGRKKLKELFGGDNVHVRHVRKHYDKLGDFLRGIYTRNAS